MKGYHKHKCRFCGFVWEHHDANDVSHGQGGAHECPGCHKCNWGMGIYVGDEEPRVRNGVGALAKSDPPVTIHPDQAREFN